MHLLRNVLASRRSERGHFRWLQNGLSRQLRWVSQSCATRCSTPCLRGSRLVVSSLSSSCCCSPCLRKCLRSKQWRRLSPWSAWFVCLRNFSWNLNRLSLSCQRKKPSCYSSRNWGTGGRWLRSHLSTCIQSSHHTRLWEPLNRNLGCLGNILDRTHSK